MVKLKTIQIFVLFFILPLFIEAQSNEHLSKESENFQIVYLQTHSHLVNHILESAEDALKILKRILKYNPTEKIVIQTYDFSDYGIGAASTTPVNTLRLFLAPLDSKYEFMPYSDRLRWLVNHELVHIAVNDKPSDQQAFFRSLFTKVSTDKSDPMTILFTLLTSSNRFSPRWHQEGFAVFLETWLGGGFGRGLSSFDEMYFRTLVNEGIRFPNFVNLENQGRLNSFTLESIFYLFGGRFNSFLAKKYGVDKLLNWYKTPDSNMFDNFKSRFENIYGITLEIAWKEFEKEEIIFQRENINKVKTIPESFDSLISNESYGWVSNPVYNKSESKIYFTSHRPNELATIFCIDLNNKNISRIFNPSTPSLLSVNSLALDSENNRLFYTTNNNQLYRDINVLNLKNGKSKELLKDVRAGNIVYDKRRQALWAVRHSQGLSSLIFIPSPFNRAKVVTNFNYGDDIINLNISPSGKYFAATLHTIDGSQKLIVAETKQTLYSNKFRYRVIIDEGSPENPSWSADEKDLYWNSYSNGVSNLYKYSVLTDKIRPITNCVTGYFQPIEINKSTLFSFRYSSNGFLPVLITPSDGISLNTINFMGQELFEKEPIVLSWTSGLNANSTISTFSKENTYSGLKKMRIQTFIPTISGFQNKKVVGLYTQIADPTNTHSIKAHLGYSPFGESKNLPNLHFDLKYEYKNSFKIQYQQNAANFGDLFSSRKKGFVGNRFNIQYNNYFIYNNPTKLYHEASIELYQGIKFFNDNIIPVTISDFILLSSHLEYKSLRRSIGSMQFEKGWDYNFNINIFSTLENKNSVLPRIYLTLNNYQSLLANHNVIHFQLTGGYLHPDPDLIQGYFFIGGFGNREIETEKVRQYREPFSFSGLPIFSIMTDRFTKFMIENNFPPITIGGSGIGSHYIQNIDFSLYSQFLSYNTEKNTHLIYNIGFQIDVKLKHWYTMESTISMGYAKTFNYEFANNDKWLVSLKLFKN